MKLKDTGLTLQDIKDKVNKYMIETYERFDFLAETAEGMYIYDENGTPYLDFYAGIAVNNAGNRNPKVVAAVKDQVDDIMHTFNYPYTIPPTITTFAMIFIPNAVPIASAVTSPVASCDFMIAPESRTSPTAIITSA